MIENRCNLSALVLETLTDFTTLMFPYHSQKGGNHHVGGWVSWVGRLGEAMRRPKKSVNTSLTKMVGCVLVSATVGASQAHATLIRMVCYVLTERDWCASPFRHTVP